MPFSSILGHEALIEGLRSAHRRGRVSHAYLFSGAEGIGKQLVATAFFQMLNCKEPTEDGDACDTCRTCRQIRTGQHPDLVKLEPDGRFIKIAQVRAATKSLRFPPVEAATRCVLVHPAEAMQEPAANALLKTLEEPSSRNVFVLLSAQPNALLATIRSRCQQVRFSVLGRDIVSKWLVDEKGLDATTADEVAGMSAGSLGAAANLMDPELSALRTQWLGVLGRLGGVTPTELLDLAETLGADKASMPAVLDALRLGLRDAMLRASGAGEGELTFRHDIGLPHMGVTASLEALSAVDEAEESLQRNVNPRMVGEHLLMGLRATLIQ